MKPEIVMMGEEAVYKFTLPEPEGKVYYIPKKEFDVIQDEIYSKWKEILEEQPQLNSIEKELLRQTFDNGKVVPPVGTKISSTSRNGKTFATIEIRESIKTTITVPISHYLPNHFSIENYYDLDTDKTTVFFGALEKQVDKTKYFSYKDASFNFYPVEPRGEIKKNRVYLYRNGANGWEAQARNDADKLFVIHYDKPNASDSEIYNYFTKELLKNNVLPEIKSSRTKYFFPHPERTDDLPDFEAFLVKTEGYLKHQYQQQEDPEDNFISPDHLVLNVYHSTDEAQRAKRHILMPYLGQSVKKYCADPNVSPQERAKICIECCEDVNTAHKENLLIVDIKPSNFVHGRDTVRSKYQQKRNFVIDDSAIINQGESSDICTPRYTAPERANSDPTIESDIYAMGVTIGDIFGDKKDELITHLEKAMTCLEPTERLPISVVSHLLHAHLVNEPQLVDFALQACTIFKSRFEKQIDTLKTYQRKMERLGTLLKNLAELAQTQNQLPSKDAQYMFIDHINTYPDSANWDTLESIEKRVKRHGTTSAKKSPLSDSGKTSFFTTDHKNKNNSPKKAPANEERNREEPSGSIPRRPSKTYEK